MPINERNKPSAAQLKKVIVQSLWVFEPAILYWAAIAQYKSKTDKKRCIALYEVFFDTSGPWGGAIAELDRQKHAFYLTHMGAMVGWMKEQRTAASKMGFFKRVMTSSERQSASSEFFDALNKAIDLEAGNGAVNGFLVDKQVRSPMGDWKQRAMKAKEKLGDAGFDISALGLNEI